jgi:hypothetical protein
VLYLNKEQKQNYFLISQLEWTHVQVLTSIKTTREWKIIELNVLCTNSDDGEKCGVCVRVNWTIAKNLPHIILALQKVD